MKSIVIANWKMNPATWREAKRLFEATKKATEGAPHVHVVIAPPALYLRELKASYRGKKIQFAAQHARAEPSGAYTGDISLAQCKDAGASYVIVGHAERREAGETNEETGKKVAGALALKMTPVLCVGETKRGSGGEHFEVVRAQLRAGFLAVEPAHTARVVVTYEPLWTIGADKAMSPRDMHEMAIFIRKSIVDMKGASGMNIKILYGGSVDGNNAPDMLKYGDVHGLLVGRASEDGIKLASLLEAIEEAK